MDDMRVRRWRAAGPDVAIAAAVLVVALVGSGHVGIFQPSRRPLDAVGYALIAAAGVALLGRRRRPMLVFTAVTALTAAYLALRYPYGPFFLALAVATATVAMETSQRRSMTAVGVAMLATLGAGVAGSALGPQGVEPWVLGWPVWLAIPWSAGIALRTARDAARRAEAQLRARREYEERMAIAREVHDVVGHGLSVINMQAAIALHVLERKPEAAKPALEAIKQASKDALDDLRGTLALVRDDTSAERGPAPGLGQLEELARATGGDRLPVTLRVSGDQSAPPAGVQRAAYRIVQESLTNVLRHAAATRAEVSLVVAADAVELKVTDDGVGAASAAHQGAGHGLAGMRERAAALGGTLTAGPGEAGGFRVSARLPYRREASR